MRTTTGGSVRRFDLAPVLDLLPALWSEWDALRFTSAGEVVDPLDGSPRLHLRLTDGQHGQPGATYVVTLPPPPSTELEILLRGDDGRSVQLTVTAPDHLWSVDLRIGRGRAPRIEVSGHADLPAVLKARAMPGCAAGLLGRRARLATTVDASALDGRGGELLVGTVRTSRFRGRGRLVATPRVARWEVAGALGLRGRGLGRAAMALFGGRMRREIDDEVQRFWADADTWATGREAELAELADDVAAAGGPAPFVRRALWDPTFRPPSIARLVDPQPSSRSSREATTAATKRSRTGGRRRSSER